ncbi:sodium-dependent transporter [Clostridium sp. D2Q-11]|uniref:Sodium-dependent transporter n=1 Tax=Anaeromonas frigoriresistens TaxID=2683708 RepID=A0A942Z6M3_9FIRM|nr:sodium-dependent transporter [Anaeromonas frigoriresistens]
MENNDRGQWGSKIGFILAVVGSAVGLGNIWRYPYLLYSNGGGAFLVPYFIALLTAGIPLVLLEYGFGHKYRGSSPLSFARGNRKFEWLGWWPSITSFIIITYYTQILSWAINYLYFSFGQTWGSDTNAFFFNDFLQISSSPFDFGGMRWPIFLGITVIWAINWFVSYKGVSGGIEKLNKVLIPTLFVIMVIIVIRGVTLPGASVGLNKLFTPDWSKVKDPNVWMDAYGQVFFSLSLAMGILVTYSSYLPKKTDINNSAFITAFANSGFEFLAAIGVFGILGFMATSQNIPIEEVASQGIGLAFVVFPKVFSLMGSLGVVFGILFFLSLVFAGLTSSISLLEAFTSAVIDKSGAKRGKVVTIVCIVGYAISVLYATGAGLYFLDIIDAFINSFSIVTVGLLEAVVIGWIIGGDKIRSHTNSISIYRVGKWWEIMIKFVTPAILTIILITKIVNEIKTPYGGGDYSTGALMLLGWGVVGAIIVLSFVVKSTKWKKGILEENIENEEVK